MFYFCMLQMKEYFNQYVDVILQYKRLNCQETVHVVELSSVMSLCKLLECLAVKQNGLNTADEDSFRTMSKMWFLFWQVLHTLPFKVVLARSWWGGSKMGLKFSWPLL